MSHVVEVEGAQRSDSPRGETGAGHRAAHLPALPDWFVVVLFAAGFVAMGLLGRLTRPEGAALAVVWPAAAVGFFWLAWAHGRGRHHVLANAAGITLLGVGINLATGAGWSGALFLGEASGAQALLAFAVMRRRHARAGTSMWRLRSVADLTTLVLASYAGGVAAAVVGIAAVQPTSPGTAALIMVSWVLRIGTSTFVLAAVGLRLLDRSAPSLAATPRRREAVAVVLATSAAYALVFLPPVSLPLSFATVPLSLWVAVRFSTTTAAAHVVPVGVLVVLATLAERGPFAPAPEALAATLLAQMFITVVAAATLTTALHRDERVQLMHQVHAAHARTQQQADLAQEQAQLFSSVLTEMDEAIALFDAEGHFLLRNRATGVLMGGQRTPDGQAPDPSALGICWPDGTPCRPEELVQHRALAGERVEEDYLLRLPDGVERIVATRASPLITPDGHLRALVVLSDVTAVRRAAAEVAQARDLFAGVLDAATDLAIISTDVHGLITVFNTGAERLLGYTAAEALGRTPYFLYDPDDLAARLTGTGISAADLLGDERRDAATLAAVARVTLGTHRWGLRTRAGATVQVASTTSLMVTGDGAVTGVMAVARDLTTELAAQAGLADSEERFRLAFETAPMGMMMVGLSPARPGAILQSNPAMTALVGYDELDLLGMNVAELSHPDDVQSAHELLGRQSSGEVTQSRTEKRYRHRDGSTVWIRLSTSVVTSDHREPYALALIEDITTRKQAEHALTQQALHDPLTGLPNRSLFRDRLEHALAAADRTGERVGVLYLDLDGFKQVNDTAGHRAGDDLLQQVAERIGGCIRPGDTLARLGGDEFALVCPGIDVAHLPGPDLPSSLAAGGTVVVRHLDGRAALGNLQVVADRILTVLRSPFELAAGTFTIGASIGMASSAPDLGPLPAHENAEKVLQAADKAMYTAKRTGRNRACAADASDVEMSSSPDGALLVDLRRALASDEIVVHGQPVLDLATGHPVAVETLVRWQHPTRGLLSPAHFLAAAEDSPLMVALGRRVLEESCRMAAAWSEALGNTAPDVHVNVSGRQLESDSLVGDVIDALRRHGLPGHRLVLELTETHMPRISPSLKADLERLRERGVRIAIDDVGTGYSSLTRLTELPVDVLKIDLSFVAGLGVDASCDAVVRAILSIGAALGVSVVAEGVETPAQEALLREYGCDTVQGYLYSPPRPEAELIEQLRRPVSVAPPIPSPRGLVTFACGDVVPGCDRVFAGTPVDVLLSVADHARLGHGLASVPDEMVQEVSAAMRPLDRHAVQA